jgi:hypothetical protein
MTTEASDEDKARQWAINIAKEHGLQDEVRDDYDRFIKAGRKPWQAARDALWEWDC